MESKSEETEKDTTYNWKWGGGKAGAATHIADKIDLKTKIVTGDKERHCIMLKGSIHKRMLQL